MAVRLLLRFAGIRIDLSVECRTNVDNEYKFEGNYADWTEAGKYKTKRNTRNVYYANYLPMRRVLVSVATHS